MSRAVPEWIGKTDDSALPTSVYLRLWRKQDGRCGKCTRKMRAHNIEREHLVPLSMGGENRESNVELWCAVPCSSEKTASEAAPRAKADRATAKRWGFKSPSKKKRPPMPGSRASKWKKKLDGTVVRRDEDD